MTEDDEAANASAATPPSIRDRNVKDETGNRHGRLTVLGRDYTAVRRGAHWRCRCDCGTQTVVRGHHLREGKTLSCGCLREDRRIAAICLPRGVAALNEVIRRIGHDAKRRGLEWLISRADAKRLLAMDCHYCGLPPSNFHSNSQGSVTWSGLDRVDSSRGYHLSNVVPCCKRCNLAKNDMTLDEFESWLMRVVRHHRARSGRWGIRQNEDAC